MFLVTHIHTGTQVLTYIRVYLNRSRKAFTGASRQNGANSRFQTFFSRLTLFTFSTSREFGVVYERSDYPHQGGTPSLISSYLSPLSSLKHPNWRLGHPCLMMMLPLPESGTSWTLIETERRERERRGRGGRRGVDLPSLLPPSTWPVSGANCQVSCQFSLPVSMFQHFHSLRLFVSIICRRFLLIDWFVRMKSFLRF